MLNRLSADFRSALASTQSVVIRDISARFIQGQSQVVLGLPGVGKSNFAKLLGTSAGVPYFYASLFSEYPCALTPDSAKSYFQPGQLPAVLDDLGVGVIDGVLPGMLKRGVRFLAVHPPSFERDYRRVFADRLPVVYFPAPSLAEYAGSSLLKGLSPNGAAFLFDLTGGNYRLTDDLLHYQFDRSEAVMRAAQRAAVGEEFTPADLEALTGWSLFNSRLQNLAVVNFGPDLRTMGSVRVSLEEVASAPAEVQQRYLRFVRYGLMGLSDDSSALVIRGELLRNYLFHKCGFKV